MSKCPWVSVAVLLASVALQPSAAVARADDSVSFKSPSGNINCVIFQHVGGDPSYAACDIRDHTFTLPPRPASCDHPNAGSYGRFTINEGQAPSIGCHSDSLISSDAQVLQFGQTRSLKSLSCSSASAGITCTDSGTGHYFRVSKESYDLH
jgi:hypothetical protein